MIGSLFPSRLQHRAGGEALAGAGERGWAAARAGARRSPPPSFTKAMRTYDDRFGLFFRNAHWRVAERLRGRPRSALQVAGRGPRRAPDAACWSTEVNLQTQVEMDIRSAAHVPLTGWWLMPARPAAQGFHWKTFLATMESLAVALAAARLPVRHRHLLHPRPALGRASSGRSALTLRSCASSPPPCFFSRQ